MTLTWTTGCSHTPFSFQQQVKMVPDAEDNNNIHFSSPSIPQFFASPTSPNTLQTEEELRHLGFHIEMSGSCTVIRHILKGTPLFVGAVFTNAPSHSAVVTRLQGRSNEFDDEE